MVVTVKNFIKLSIIFFSVSSNAYSASWENVGLVTRVHSGHGIGYFLFSTEKQINVNGCDNRFGYDVNENLKSSDRIYSLLLTAYTTGKPVAIYITGNCLGGRPEVNAVQFTDTGYF
ncbi:hypothetical protein M3P05_12550 [Sansalvadorimonas sp. 2012CJ34-2]|uniref:Uncharacterized protein n=1 Tax=Parendozoicomonas callyspongiae TaxID=2942213 RepID=A0ABT0PH92_9GAMM|nr:hypothetical protein [Sansalvadorimonas sp. 2012CJ34-2]MCL6270754.1 hypothetical protein [Sansalvadorimonas sp. 2012CJ34-2]